MYPLALCLDRTQSNNATMSRTVALLLYCYHFYFNLHSDSGVYMLQCIGHRWNYLNKQAYFVAYFLDPEFFISGIKVDWFSLSKFVDELYTRVFKVVPVNILSEISIYKKMDKQRLQLQGKADVFWELGICKGHNSTTCQASSSSTQCSSSRCWLGTCI